MSDSVRPHRWQPTRLCRPWDSPGKNTGVGCHFLLQCMKVKSESEVAQLCLTLHDPMDCSLPGSSMGFSRQEYWSGVPLPSLKEVCSGCKKEQSGYCRIFILPCFPPSHEQYPFQKILYSQKNTVLVGFRVRFVVVLSLSHVGLFTTPWTAACQTSLSMVFPRQGYWSGLPFPSLGDLTDPGIKPVSPALGRQIFFYH